jgi:hypothetical protein
MVVEEVDARRLVVASLHLRQHVLGKFILFNSFLVRYSMKLFVYVAFATVLCSCGVSSASKSENVLAFNSFDEMEGWVPESSLAYLTRDKSHSSPYSACVNQANEYAGTYTTPLGRLSPTRLTKMRMHAWVWLPGRDAKAALVMQVTAPATNKQLVYDAIDLATATKETFNKWVEVEKVISLPLEVNSASLLKTYLWRGGSAQTVYLDDFQLERAE